MKMLVESLNGYMIFFKYIFFFSFIPLFYPIKTSIVVLATLFYHLQVPMKFTKTKAF